VREANETALKVIRSISERGWREVACGEWCIEETRRIIEKQGAETTLAFFVEPI
jgi:adenosylmethionine-8-amino-7-oxononanoate aminotransferase